jgi:hypothetical protein
VILICLWDIICPLHLHLQWKWTNLWTTILLRKWNSYNNTTKCHHLVFIFLTFPNLFLKLCFHIKTHFCLIAIITRHVKLFMDTLHISYADIKDEFTMYVTTGFTCKVVHGTLTPYQMAQFLVEFNITDTSIWSDHSFDQEKQLLENL